MKTYSKVDTSLYKILKASAVLRIRLTRSLTPREVLREKAKEYFQKRIILPVSVSWNASFAFRI